MQLARAAAAATPVQVDAQAALLARKASPMNEEKLPDGVESRTEDEQLVTVAELVAPASVAEAAMAALKSQNEDLRQTLSTCQEELDQLQQQLGAFVFSVGARPSFLASECALDNNLPAEDQSCHDAGQDVEYVDEQADEVNFSQQDVSLESSVSVEVMSSLVSDASCHSAAESCATTSP
eukprot:6187706-Pleurochrysis_carterae.AAC.1